MCKHHIEQRKEGKYSTQEKKRCEYMSFAGANKVWNNREVSHCFSSTVKDYTLLFK